MGHVWTRLNTLLLLLVLLGMIAVFAQRAAGGPLDPPGPVGSTMKSLDQVEPRTPISSLPFNITQPGSYYLTTNLTGVAGDDGIFITASDVIIDLNAFTMTGDPASFAGILCNGTRARITVRNGAVASFPDGAINLACATNVIVDDVRVVQQVNSPAVRLGPDSTITNCNVEANALAFGIHLLENSRLSRCHVISGYESISAAAGSIIEDCSTRDSTSIGIGAGPESAVRDCLVTGFGGSGVYASGDAVVMNNTIDADGELACGIGVIGAGTRLEANHVTEVFLGVCLSAGSSANTVLRNSFRGVTVAIDDQGLSNDIGPLENAATAGRPFANILLLEVTPTGTATPTATATATPTPTP